LSWTPQVRNDGNPQSNFANHMADFDANANG
jgi:hypothetical protein